MPKRVVSGDVMVGHFGAPARFSYTALGDGVNLAARLEGLNKQYGTTILVSAAVAEAVGGEFELRPVGRCTVKGKSQAVDVFELKPS
jgi:adenylate cyclase